MACPYFMPVEPLAEPLWPHPQRLPLGGGYTGYCTAGRDEESRPTADELRDFCNMGYATRCSRLPQERAVDSHRFRVTQAGAQIAIFFCSELRHAPVEQATLIFDQAGGRWIQAHSNTCVQRQAESALRSWQAQRAPAQAPLIAELEPQNA